MYSEYLKIYISFEGKMATGCVTIQRCLLVDIQPMTDTENLLWWWWWWLVPITLPGPDNSHGHTLGSVYGGMVGLDSGNSSNLTISIMITVLYVHHVQQLPPDAQWIDTCEWEGAFRNLELLI